MVRAVVLRTVWVLGLLVLAAPASAQVVQSIHFGAGAFVPRGFDARAEGDVLNENLNTLVFKIGDFKAAQVFGEWMFGFGDHVEVAAGLAYGSRRVPSLYADFVNVDGREIEQDLRLRVVPMTAVVRFLPVGRPGDLQPYVGVGVGAFAWRYSESGEFVDFSDFSVFRARYVDSGVALGPVILGGLRVPLNGDIYGLTIEGRYRFAVGDLDPAVGFLTDRIDLGGGSFNVGFVVRF